MKPAEIDLYHELICYTLAHGDPSFIHQHVVDAFAAQCADECSKPNAVTFALVGLFLHLEKSYTGRHVQLAHMNLARRRKDWVMPPMPPDRGNLRVCDVLAAEAGPMRDAAIHEWCASVWDAWKPSQPVIVALVRETLGIS